MRPIVFEQNPLLHPLNELLGTEAHVRLVRTLANDVDGSLTTSDAAERAGITPQGALKALKRLVQSGFVIQVGGGRKRQYALRLDDNLVQAIVKLFHAEANRYELFIEDIKNTIENSKPPPQSVWIDKFPRELNDSVVLEIIHHTPYLNNYIHELRKELNSVEQDFDITIEVLGYTKADAPSINPGKIIHLYGIPPFTNDYANNLLTGFKTHEDVDDRLLEICHSLAPIIEKDSSLVRRARKRVENLQEKDQGSAKRDIEEWHDILESYSLRRLLNFLISTSERATRLRQSCPFFAVLNESEKARLNHQLRGEIDT